MHKVVPGATVSPCASCRKILQKLYLGGQGKVESFLMASFFQEGRKKA